MNAYLADINAFPCEIMYELLHKLLVVMNCLVR